MRVQRVSGKVRTVVAAGLALSMTALVGCGGSGSDAATTTDADGGARTTTTADATPSTGADSTSSTASPTLTTVAPGLPDATEAQHTAPPDGTGTALLKAVRVGRNEGFERIVFEFAGTSVPGYTIEWVDPPILSDGAGEVVDVAGDAFLQMVLQPASGVDLSAPELTVIYQGPDRITTNQTELIEDLVRTGDFEAVLTWVAGTTEEVPFRVLTLANPTRIVVDLETS